MRNDTDPPQRGLYTPDLEKDSCGTGLIAQLRGEKSHQLIADALRMLTNMEHRGACGCEANVGDGAGILLQTPDAFFREISPTLGFDLPPFGHYGVGVTFFPTDATLQVQCRTLLLECLEELDFRALGFRDVPVDPHSGPGRAALATAPRIQQLFVASRKDLEPAVLERQLFILRKYITHRIYEAYPAAAEQFYFASFSYKTIIYKGQLTTYQVRPYFLDLQDARLTSAIALVHSRFSTNTVPKWKLAQPFRYIAHNGEINTIKGNLNWWRAKEKLLDHTQFTEVELQRLLPICGRHLSDSANFDNVLEFLVIGGRSLPHALMMMIPEAWQHDAEMAPYKKAFYEFHENLMEPWDGPASICFTDGIVVGATLDRNGLRPSRYTLTTDDVLVVASEAGALPIAPARVLLKGRLQPGRMLMADLEQHRIIGDEELKRTVCQRLPYQRWLRENRTTLAELPPGATPARPLEGAALLQQQRLFGYTQEDLKVLIAPMIQNGKDPIGSMGSDTPLAVLSHQSQHLSNYFKQLFAQVTNPPIDPIRERSVMSLGSLLGIKGSVLTAQAEQARFIHLDQPILTDAALNQLQHIERAPYRPHTLSLHFPADGQEGQLRRAIERCCTQAETAVNEGVNLLILSDRGTDEGQAPIPSLLATGAIHHHLVNVGLRGKASLIVEAGDARETHHFATLFGYGADAINPYLAFSSIAELRRGGYLEAEKTVSELQRSYVKALGKGLLKIMSKNGISTLQSYRGAQIFEAVGIAQSVIDQCFHGTISRIEGLDFDGLAQEILYRHQSAHQTTLPGQGRLDAGGVFQWKRRGEFHLFNPQTIHLLQHATRNHDYATYRKYARLINEQSEQACTLRGLLDFRPRTPILLEAVEPVEHILRRFATGAMSFGSISYEAHRTLAIAMNRIGGKSNSGEGGEDESRYRPLANGDSERSAIKQVASGRFGVTSHYLSQAEELQIKMAQGAKPGEGGHLPGHKVNDWIARVRHSTPGVGLISPPPHHDIYSIEDLAQLIFDLKNANREARINVKLVSKAGVGVIASGVAKAHADAILIAGHDGGTGASPLTSIRHAGLPWELGLAESHQTLLKNRLRDRVVLQADGQMRTGRDLAIATLLGAEEWGIATAALVVEGCIMMRKCHMNTCPVGIATQDPDLRKKFTAQPEHLISFFRFLAEDLREIMAELGFRTVNEMVGQVSVLRLKEDLAHWKYQSLDLRPLLYQEPVGKDVGQYQRVAQDHGIDHILDHRLMIMARPALELGKRITGSFPIANTDRAVGTMLSYEVSKRYGSEGLSPGTIQYRFRGAAGQSFGAFAARGLQFTLEGEANDYFGKGLSGARLIVSQDREATFRPEENIIIGNVAFYGATSGEAYIKGMAGERFCVRNSGVKAVVEGVGDHGCEYMTGGVVVVLGETGKNFGAGMSGGVAYIYDPERQFAHRCNPELVDLESLDTEDFRQLRILVRNHFRYTSSKRALGLLQDWNRHREGFVKVMPRDYKKALARMETPPATRPTSPGGRSLIHQREGRA